MLDGSLGSGAILASEPFFAHNRVSNGGREPAFFCGPQRTKNSSKSSQKNVKNGYEIRSPTVELLVLGGSGRPPERLPHRDRQSRRCRIIPRSGRARHRRC